MRATRPRSRLRSPCSGRGRRSGSSRRARSAARRGAAAPRGSRWPAGRRCCRCGSSARTPPFARGRVGFPRIAVLIGEPIPVDRREPTAELATALTARLQARGRVARRSTAPGRALSHCPTPDAVRPAGTLDGCQVARFGADIVRSARAARRPRRAEGEPAAHLPALPRLPRAASASSAGSSSSPPRSASCRTFLLEGGARHGPPAGARGTSAGPAHRPSWRG